MKITNENVGWWLFGGLSISCMIPFLIYSKSIVAYNFLCLGGFIGICTLILGLFSFLIDCNVGNIKFEINLKEVFGFLLKSRLTPEEQDKKNK